MPMHRLAAAAVVIAAAGAAAAQSAPQPATQSDATPMCAPRSDIVAQLEKKYGETRRGAGLQNRGAVTEVFASAKTGTWTIIVTRPDGTSCAVAAGEAWLEEVASAETPPA